VLSIDGIVGKHTDLETSVTSLAYNFIKCSSLSRVYDHVGDGLFIISASRGEYAEGEEAKGVRRIKTAGIKSISKANFDRYRALQADLIAQGVGYITTIGKYWEETKTGERYQVEELSAVVPFRNRPSAKITGSVEEFEDFAMSMAVKYEQDSYLVVRPGQGEKPKAELVFTGLYSSPKGDRYEVGPTNITSPLDDYLTILQRGNKNARFPGDKAVKFAAPPEAVAASDKAEIGIRGPNGGWAGQILAAQLEILFL